MAGQMEEGGKAAGGTGELGRPAGEVGEVAAVGSEPGLEVVLEAEQQLGGRRLEGQQDRALVVDGSGQAGGQGLELEGIAVGHRRWHRWSAGLAAADQTLGEAVQESCQQAPAPEPGPSGQALQDFGLHGQADGQTGPLDVFGWSAAAVDLEQIPGMALEVDPEVGAGALVVAAGHLVEHVTFG